MKDYLIKRVLGIVPVFFGVTLLIFFMMTMAPATIADLAGGELTASGDAQRASLEAKLGLDQPWPLRYLTWLGELCTGDLGQSYRTGQPVLNTIAQRVGPTLLLTGSGVLLAVLVGIPLGVMAAWKRGSLWEKCASLLSLCSFGLPSFFLCLGGVYVFSLRLGWLPASGMYTAGTTGSLADLLRHLILPASVVALASLGNLIRQTRSACLEVLSEDYIRAARARGLREGVVVWKHGLRAASIPVLTAVLNHIPHVVGGSMVVERIFGWPGMGSLLFSAVGSRDYPVIMGVATLVALAVLVASFLMDVAYHLADPRMSWGGEGP